MRVVDNKLKFTYKILKIMVQPLCDIVEVNEQDRVAFSWHVFINYEYRFIFFTIPKVACTSWIQLFFRLKGDKDWLSDPHYRKDRPFLSHLGCEEIELYLNNPAWTKAVFFRDPAERLLSAYLNKIKNGSYITRRLFNAGAGEISFEQFVEYVTNGNENVENPNGLHAKTDPHWKSQRLTSSIEKLFPCIDFIGDFSHLQEDSRALLEKLGLWNEYGSSGWSANKDGAMFEYNNAHNKTGANGRLKEFYTDELLNVVKNAYLEDYLFLSRCGLNYSL